jgi:hypothetical protein
MLLFVSGLLFGALLGFVLASLFRRVEDKNNPRMGNRSRPWMILGTSSRFFWMLRGLNSIAFSFTPTFASFRFEATFKLCQCA